MVSRNAREVPGRAPAASGADLEWLQVLFETSPNGILLQDAGAGILQANAAACRILGLPAAQLQGRTWIDPRWRAVTEEGLPFPAEELPARVALATGRPVANVVMGVFDPAREETRWLEVSAVPLPSEQTTRVVVTFTDITERKRMAEERDRLLAELRQGAMELDGIFDALPYLVILLGQDGRYLRVNPTVRTVFGFDPLRCAREETARRLKARLADGRMLTPELMPSSRALAGEAVHDFEYRITDSEGLDHDLLMNAIPLVLDGEVRGAVLAQHDITRHRRAERDNARLQELLAQARRLDSLGSLAGGVAHDMNNVLGAILALASAQQKLLPGDDPSRPAFETIARAATRGAGVVKSLLSFARSQLAEVRPMDLNAILREDAALLERTTFARLRISLELEPALLPTLGDPGAVAHALMNLCVNAVEAMPEGGSLVLRSRNLEADWVEVTVEDTGPGMTPEVLEKAVDPFFTTKTLGQGAGLGLSQVYSTMRAHKGDLELESEPGRGTRVSLRFPGKADLVPEAPAEGPGRSLRVLLVDDDELIQSSIRMILEKLGHQVRSALCGEDAIRAVQDGLRPDLVILDLNMPGLGGAGTLPVLRELCPETPVLLATGRADEAALALAASHPLATLLAKPYDLEDLQRFLGRAGDPGGVSG